MVTGRVVVLVFTLMVLAFYYIEWCYEKISPCPPSPFPQSSAPKPLLIFLSNLPLTPPGIEHLRNCNYTSTFIFKSIHLRPHLLISNLVSSLSSPPLKSSLSSLQQCSGLSAEVDLSYKFSKQFLKWTIVLLLDSLPFYFIYYQVSLHLPKPPRRIPTRLFASCNLLVSLCVHVGMACAHTCILTHTCRCAHHHVHAHTQAHTCTGVTHSTSIWTTCSPELLP